MRGLTTLISDDDRPRHQTIYPQETKNGRDSVILTCN